MASALAATALVWKSSDTDYFNTCMTAAKSLYDYASNVLGNYQSSVRTAAVAACFASSCLKRAAFALHAKSLFGTVKVTEVLDSSTKALPSSSCACA